jgi:hypothetical protein
VSGRVKLVVAEVMLALLKLALLGVLWPVIALGVVLGLMDDARARRAAAERRRVCG